MERLELLDSLCRLLAKNELDPNLNTLFTLSSAIRLIELSMLEPAMLSFLLFLVLFCLSSCISLLFFALIPRRDLRKHRELRPLASLHSLSAPRRLHHAI